MNARNEQGETPLNLACLKRSEKNAMWLIRKGVDVNISNKYVSPPGYQGHPIMYNTQLIYYRIIEREKQHYIKQLDLGQEILFLFY